MSDGKIRVVLVDDHAVVRSGLRAVLGSAGDIEVVGEAANGDEAITVTTTCTCAVTRKKAPPPRPST